MGEEMSRVRFLDSGTKKIYRFEDGKRVPEKTVTKTNYCSIQALRM
jgi:hypothetical protein